MSLVKIPGHIPQQGYTDENYLKNPMGSVPYPYPASMPEGLWQQNPFTMSWTTTGLPAGVAARSVWSSPTFDLLPNMRGSMSGGGNTGTGDNNAAQPIWIPRGAMGQLRVQLTGLNVVGWSRYGLRVTSQERANILDPSDMQAVTPERDLTTELAGTQPSAILPFLPTGGGYPVRFWNVEITFDMTQAPEWRLGAAYY